MHSRSAIQQRPYLDRPLRTNVFLHSATSVAKNSDQHILFLCFTFRRILNQRVIHKSSSTFPFESQFLLNSSFYTDIVSKLRQSSSINSLYASIIQNYCCDILLLQKYQKNITSSIVIFFSTMHERFSTTSRPSIFFFLPFSLRTTRQIDFVSMKQKKNQIL